MLWKLLLLFTVLPVLELTVLIKLSGLTTTATTIAVVILTGVLGAALARREGWKTWTRIQQNLSQGVSPADEVLGGLLILIAGALLITPGLLTDTVGLALLIPALRRRLQRRLARYFQEHLVVMTPTHPRTVVDYEIIDLPPD